MSTRRPSARTLTCGLLLLALLGGVTGCAVSEERNRRVLGWMDRELSPEETGARWVLLPVTLPCALVGLALDAFIVHPATVFDDAWLDTVDLLWTPGDASRFRRTLLLPLSVLATPIVYFGDWLGRAAFAIPPREGPAP